MKAVTVIDNEFAYIRYYPDTGIIHHEWKQFCSGKPFQDIMLSATHCLRDNKGTKWLSDDTNYFMLSEEDSLWGQKVWFYEAITVGWKHWAVILPNLQIGKTSISGLLTEYRAAGINAKSFDNVTDAMAWLEAQ